MESILQNKKKYELEQICRENNIKKFSGKKKQQIIDLIISRLSSYAC